MENDEIDLRQLLKLLWDKKVTILIIVLIAVIAGWVYTSFMVKPVYTSSIRLILAQKNTTDASTGVITQTDVTLNDKLIDTYKEIAVSNSVIRTVINNLDLKNVDEDVLKKEINVTAVTGTQILKISVTDKDADRATKIANEMGKVFSERIKDIYKIENVSVLDEAETQEEPSNVNHKRDMLIFLAVGIVLAIAIVLLANMLDNSIKSSADIETLNLTVLAEIPECDFGSKR
jgi:capsular polysaccharide biosynthesis protein